MNLNIQTIYSTLLSHCILITEDTAVRQQEHGKCGPRSTSILIEYRNNPKVFHTTVGGLMLPSVMFIYAWRKCTLLKLAAAVMHAVWNYCCIDHTALNRIFTEEPSIICELSRRNIGYINDKK